MSNKMIFESISLSYTQEVAEKLMANFIPTPNGRLQFQSTYGCGDLSGRYSTQMIKWEDLKEDLFVEYDDLWKELAKR